MTAIHFDRDGNARCGNGGRSPVTGTEADVTCGRCLGLLAGTNGAGRQWCDVKPCGTEAAYRRHLRRDGKPVRCKTCLQAEARRTGDAQARRRRERKGLAA